MYKTLLLISFLFVTLIGSAQKVVVSGFAPAYIGSTIELYGIEDFLSQTEKRIASGTVEADSTFSISFKIDQTQKIIVKSNNNHGYLLVQPNAHYSIFFPDKDKFTPYKPSGNEIELSFLKLDSTDINYKVLGFQRWVDHFIGNNYHLKSLTPEKIEQLTAEQKEQIGTRTFGENLDRFKSNVEKAYKEDTSEFFKMYVRFSIAGLDNITHAAERNRYEKYDFYLKHTPVQYKNEVYMGYMRDFYQRLTPRLSNETNEAVYQGVLHSSPTKIMKALGSEYTLSNLQLRELVMMNMLTEVYTTNRYPKTNIITILDSLSNGALFQQHRPIAGNLIDRLTDLVPGGEAPSIVFIEEGKPTKTLMDFSGKHIYIQFIDLESDRNREEILLLKETHAKYSEYVHFITVYKKDKELSEKAQEAISNIPWDVYGMAPSNSIWKNYSVKTFPLYSLLDATGYVVASPSLGPTPNGQYDTIDKTFFYIKKAIVGQSQGNR